MPLAYASRFEDSICCCGVRRDASPHGRTALTFVEVPHPAIIGKRWCTDRFTAQLTQGEWAGSEDVYVVSVLGAVEVDRAAV